MAPWLHGLPAPLAPSSAQRRPRGRASPKLYCLLFPLARSLFFFFFEGKRWGELSISHLPTADKKVGRDLFCHSLCRLTFQLAVIRSCVSAPALAIRARPHREAGARAGLGVNSSALIAGAAPPPPPEPIRPSTFSAGSAKRRPPRRRGGTRYALGIRLLFAPSREEARGR